MLVAFVAEMVVVVMGPAPLTVAMFVLFSFDNLIKSLCNQSINFNFVKRKIYIQRY